MADQFKDLDDAIPYRLALEFLVNRLAQHVDGLCSLGLPNRILQFLNVVHATASSS